MDLIVSTTNQPTVKHDDLTTIRRRPVSQTYHRGSGCQKLTVPLCQSIGYNHTMFPNSLKHQTQEEAGIELHQFDPLIQVDCSPNLQLFLCSVYAPICEVRYQHYIPPCRSLCESARSGCEDLMRQYGFHWPSSLNCSRYPARDHPSAICLFPNKQDGIPTSKPFSTNQLRTTMKTPPLPLNLSSATLHVTTPSPQTTPSSTAKSEPSNPMCGGILTTTQGVVTSPNYPNAYPLQTQCKWTIKLPNFYHFVKITINTMRLEEDRNCFYDYVMIVDKMLNQVGPRHCGTYRQPYVIPVRGSEVTIVFVSDGNTNKKGFSLSYKGLRT